MKPGMRILVIEDDPAIARLLELELTHRGYAVSVVENGLTALDAVTSYAPDVIVLDIMLPGMDGEQILFRLRKQGVRTPVVMLTARDTSRDKIRNLDVGADDYLTKPFEIDELLARMRAVLRRVTVDDVIRIGDLTINVTERHVRRGENAISLSAREFALLEYLGQNARRVLSRQALLERVWGEDAEVDPNVLDVYIGYLRRKLAVDGAPDLIRTVRGVGFTLRD